MRERGGEDGMGEVGEREAEEVKVDMMYSSTKSTKFLPEGLVSRDVDAWA